MIKLIIISVLCVGTIFSGLYFTRKHESKIVGPDYPGSFILSKHDASVVREKMDKFRQLDFDRTYELDTIVQLTKIIKEAYKCKDCVVDINTMQLVKPPEVNNNTEKK